MVVKAAKQQDETHTPPVGQRRRPNRFKDLSGVQCPLNYARIKVQLFAMNSGEVLEVILDDGKPVTSVSESVRAEGHTILSQERSGGQWSVLIQKA
ncbi:MAG: sulfurtransferase TusA family protein [Candidatus Electrothrix sp. AUS1_2]|nr:sulfurtransferase TusA family protein [Candidatus Electrothrix sp. AUS1_2]